MFSYLFNNNFVAPRPTDHKEFSVLLNDGRVNEILTLLRKNNHGIEINTLYDGYRPLHYACRIGSIELVLELLTQGALVDENAKSIDGNFPLHIATIHNQRLIVEVLIRSGADTSLPNGDGKIPVELTDSIDIKNLLLKDRKVQKSMSSLLSPIGIVRQEMQLLSVERTVIEGQQENIDFTLSSPPMLNNSLLNISQSSSDSSAFKTSFNVDDEIMGSPVLRRESVRPISDTPTKYDEYNTKLSAELSSPSRDESYSAAWSPQLSHIDRNRIRLGSDTIVTSNNKLDLTSIGPPPTDNFLTSSARRLSKEGTPRSQGQEEDNDLALSILDAAKETIDHFRGSNARWNNAKSIIQACQDDRKDPTRFKNKLQRASLLLQSDPKLANYRLTKLGNNCSNLDGWCPLHCAAYENNIDAAKLLIEHGASTWSRELLGRTPLHIAAERGLESMCEFLKEKMAEEKKVVPIGENAPTDLGGTTPSGSAAIGSAFRNERLNNSMKKLLFSPGDKTVLPRTPRSTRGGKSPWKAPGAIDRENLVFGHSEANGWKESMEDKICISCPVPGRPAWSFFAILDGHGGDYVASFLKDNLPSILVNEITLAAVPNTPQNIVDDMETTPMLLENILMKVCASAEKQLSEDPYLKVEVREKSGNLYTPHDSSGSTGCLCLITSNYVAIANVGDSRAVRAQRDPSSPTPMHISAIPMSRDHKFNIPEERERAIASGSNVAIIGDPQSYTNEEDIKYEVDCPRYKDGEDKLRMSRSFGDFWLKGNKDLPEHKQAVIAVPDITIHIRSVDDAFLIIACDGIFDVMTNDEVVKFIAEKVGYNSFGGPVGGTTPNSVAEVCYSLLETCMNKDAHDNLSCIVIMLGQPQTRRRSASPTESLSARRRSSSPTNSTSLSSAFSYTTTGVNKVLDFESSPTEISEK